MNHQLYCLSMIFHLEQSPLFCGIIEFRAVGFNLRKFSNSFFHGDRTLDMARSSFHNFLNHPIAFISCNSRIKISDAFVSVKDCRFCSCISSEPGGAIYTTSTSATVNITNCIFNDCSSTGSFSVSYININMKAGGGGCALLCSKFYVKLCCFLNCYSVERGPALFTASNGFDDAVFNNSVIFHASGGICPIHFGQGKAIMSDDNSTSNICIVVPGGGFTYSGTRNLLQYSSILHCISTRISTNLYSRTFDFSLGSSAETCRMCNIVNNTSYNNLKCVFYSYLSQLTFSNFVFYKNDSPLFVKEAGLIRIENCISDTIAIGSATQLSGNILSANPVHTHFFGIVDICQTMVPTIVFNTISNRFYILLLSFCE